MGGSGVSGGTPGFAGADGGLIGRDAELSRLRGLVDPLPVDSSVLVLLGEAGMGKTVLLAEVVARARESGMTVLSAAGRESERVLAFAGLHQLLRPVLARVADLPSRQGEALLGALALAEEPVPPDALLTGMAVLTLLSAVTEAGPLLVVADDAQWLDYGSLTTLAFAARRLAAEPVTLLVAARGTVPPAALDRGFPELMLRPLSDLDAGRLLDAQPASPRGRARAQVLAEAAGNPMALVELARIITTDPAAGRRWAAEPLRPTDRLAAIAAADFAALPAASRGALLLAAVADTSDLASVGLPGFSAEALAPAEAAGLVRVDTSGPRFTHPLVRSAIYHAVPFAERAAAHRRIAEAMRDHPDRYAWHLAAAALGPDESVAALLEETAGLAQRRGGTVAAARAMERAAELSPDVPDQARRLLAAATLAEVADQSDWIQDLAARVLTLSQDPVQRILARGYIGWALSWSSRHADALATLLAVATEAAAEGLASAAWSFVALAATVAYQTGAEGDREAVLNVLRRLEEPAAGESAQEPAPATEVLLWPHSCLEPFRHRSGMVASLRKVAAGPVDDIATLGAAAWLLDESETAIRLLREALRRLRSEGVRGHSGATAWARRPGPSGRRRSCVPAASARRRWPAPQAPCPDSAPSSARSSCSRAGALPMPRSPTGFSCPRGPSPRTCTGPTPSSGSRDDASYATWWTGKANRVRTRWAVRRSSRRARPRRPRST
ncbi:MAG TPA: AAA family ATPase [Trebonia sp.]|nr:AAA family ATPase [Trebonia sp.]